MRAIPENNLGYPVLVRVSDGSTGSGFYLRDEPYVYFVTAKHILFDPQSESLLGDKAQLTSYGREVNDTTKTVFDFDLRTLQPGHIATDRARDLVVVRFLNRSSGDYQVAKGVTNLSTAKSGLVVVHRNTIRKFADVLISNPVIIFGYPVSLGLKDIPQLDYERPLLRQGIVAGKNERQGTLILDCPAYAGNSGGLVLEVEQDAGGGHYRAIGMVLQFVPAIQPWFDAKGNQAGTGVVNSGYSIATPLDVVTDLAATLPQIG